MHALAAAVALAGSVLWFVSAQYATGLIWLAAGAIWLAIAAKRRRSPECEPRPANSMARKLSRRLLWS
jgi:hypothetical protein